MSGSNIGFLFLVLLIGWRIVDIVRPSIRKYSQRKHASHAYDYLIDNIGDCPNDYRCDCATRLEAATMILAAMKNPQPKPGVGGDYFD